MSFGYSEDYRRDGEIVPFGFSLVGYPDVQDLPQIAEHEFIDVAPTRRDFEGGGVTSRAGGVYIPPEDYYDLHDPGMFVTAKVSRADDIPSWQMLTAKLTKGNGDSAHSNAQYMFRVETIGDEVLSAVKAVKKISGTSELHIEGDDPVEEVTQERQMHETPMTTADCLSLYSMFTHAAERAIEITGRRRRRASIWKDI